MPAKKPSFALTSAFMMLTLTILGADTLAANPDRVVHAFIATARDGNTPVAGLVRGADGNLYGTTVFGGAYGKGVVYELTPSEGGSWTEKTLHSFGQGHDGIQPSGGLTIDALGNLYGTTETGGRCSWPDGCGTVFELHRRSDGVWTYRILYEFNYTDGAFPVSGLVFDATGRLYGTTTGGGIGDAGVAFELARGADGRWAEQVLHYFHYDGTDGNTPESTLIMDTAGNLYGTTETGGTYGYGTAFELTRNQSGEWSENILHNFNYDEVDGWYPAAGLTFDDLGNLYGTTYGGGTSGWGTVFELTPTAGGSWSETILHDFNDDGTDGAALNDGLIFDTAGNLYGTTQYGGSNFTCGGHGPIGCGTVFELSPTQGGEWQETILHNFQNNGKDGYYPTGTPILYAGDLYGTTTEGGSGKCSISTTVIGCGIVFSIKLPNAPETTPAHQASLRMGW
jgi:uncharacterized repeat protein (TIGR03803 family)